MYRQGFTVITFLLILAEDFHKHRIQVTTKHTESQRNWMFFLQFTD